MKLPVEERKQIENEMIFRRVNEKVGRGLDKLDAMHVKDGNPHLVRNDDLRLEFKCECSDENCEARIPVRLSIYRTIHEDRNCFIVKPNHQVTDIEVVIKSENTYNVVKKNHSTPEPGDTLNQTSVNNSENS